ncbi:MAG: TRAP transporter large permease [Zoogloeaceae bacterium]|nr:TRAP transporter large permease [Zoogloeaceae bacterium]
MTGILMVLGLLALILINVPIGVALGVVAAVTMVASHGTDSLLSAAITMFSGATNFPLLAIPLFILAGAIMNSSSLSRRLIAFASAIFGCIKGGLAMVNIGTSLFFAEISGSAVADVAAMGSILIPAMKKKGYPKEFAAAVTSSSATLAVIIPPSIPMILYAVMADASVVQIFVAGIVPGVVGGLMMFGLAYWYAVRYNYPVEEVFSWQKLKQTGKEAGWAFLLPLIILGGIFGGVVTATEGAALAVLAALFIGGVIYRELNWKHLYDSMLDGGIQTAVVMLLVAASAMLGHLLTELQMPQQIAAWMTSLTDNKYYVLMMLNVFFLLCGLFLHSAAAIILVVPIVMPLVNAVGIDPVHFGLIVTLNLGIGQQTPPVASVLAASCSIAKADMWKVTRVNLPFIGVLVFLLLMVTYVPAIPMYLVETFYR